MDAHRTQGSQTTPREGTALGRLGDWASAADAAYAAELERTSAAAAAAAAEAAGMVAAAAEALRATPRGATRADAAEHTTSPEAPRLLLL